MVTSIKNAIGKSEKLVAVNLLHLLHLLFTNTINTYLQIR